ncbi:MAG: hypothetical protein DCC58_13270 [Chloroflexi bacterium]|nr:MAG: hypothetical protein DCC58_13270 [Chloroflexota bacterium]
MAPEYARRDPLLRYLADRRGRRALGVLGTLLLLAPVVVAVGAAPSLGGSVWLLPVLAVAIGTLLWGRRGAYVALAAHALISVGVALASLTGRTSAPATEMLIALLVSTVVAWLALRYRMSEQQRVLLEAQAEATADGVIVVGPTGRIISMNQRFLAVWGLPPDARRLQRIEDLRAAGRHHLLDPDAHVRRVSALYADPLAVGSTELALRDGRTLEEFTAPVLAGDGALVGRIWHYRDVTERKLAELLSRENEARFRGAFDDAGNAMALTAMDGRFLRVNDAMCALLGYTREELLARTFPSVTAPEDIDRQLALAQPLIEGKQASYQMEKRYVHKDGHYVPAIVTVAVVHGVDGRPDYTVVHIQDITALKQVEQALRESEERFRSAFDDASGATITTLDGHFIRVNAAFCDMLGYSADELIGRHFRDVTHPDDGDRQAQQGDLVAEGVMPSFQMEKRYIRKDGSVVYGMVTVSALHGIDGKPTAIVSHVEDISEFKAAQEALRESEERFRGAFDSASIGMALVSPEGRWLRVNEPLCRMLGYTAEELALLTFQDLTHPDDLMIDLAYVRQVLAGEIPSYQMEKRYLHRSGHIIWGLLSVSLVRDQAGNPLHFISQVQDITERKLVEHQLRESEERFRTLAGAAPIGIFQADTRGMCRYVNAGWTAITGIEASESVVIPWFHPVHPDDRCAAIDAWHAAEHSGRDFVVDTRFVHTNGTVRHVHVHCAALFDADGTHVGMVGAVEDLTERTLAEEELRRREREFKALAENAPDVIIRYTRDYRLTYANPVAVQVMGRPAEELIGRSGFEVATSPERAIFWEQQVNAVVASGQTIEVEFESSTLGTPSWFHARVVPEFDSTGQVESVLLVAHDITARKVGELALRESEERFRAAIEGSMDAFHILRAVRDETGTIIDFELVDLNSRAASFLNVSADVAIGRRVRELFPDYYESGFFETYVGVVNSGQPLEEEFLDPTPGYEGCWLRHQIVPLADGLAITSRDITEERRAEEALRASEELFRAAVHGSMDSFQALRAIRNAAGEIVDFEFVELNARAEEFLRIDRSKALGRPASEFFPAYLSMPIFEKHKQVVETGAFFEEEFLDDTPGFEGSWVRHQLIPLRDGVAISSRDVTAARMAAEALRESEERFRAAAQGSFDAFFTLRAIRADDGAVVDFQIVDLNARAEEFLRVTRDDALRYPISHLMPSYKETGFFDKYVQVMRTGEPFEEELRDPTPGFEGAWLHHQIVPLADGVAITSRDITQRREIENALRDSEERFRSAFANAVTGMARITPEGHFLEVNPAFSLVFGYADADLHARTLLDLTHPDDQATLSEQLHSLVQGTSQAIQQEGRFINRAGHMFWGLLGASLIRNRDGEPAYFICQILDITARKEQEQRLLRQAQHDPLTSLPNRLLFMERLDRALESAARRGESIAVMYLDLDGFKSVNDTLGHLVGDQLLAEVGKRLSRCIRAGDTVARLGGDEFSIIAEGVLDEETATRIAERVIDAFAQPFSVGGASIDVGISIGIAFSAPERSNPDTLLHEADVALYQAKAAGKRRFVIYRNDLTPEQEDQLLAERTTG